MKMRLRKVILMMGRLNVASEISRINTTMLMTLRGRPSHTMTNSKKWKCVLSDTNRNGNESKEKNLEHNMMQKAIRFKRVNPTKDITV